MRYEKITKNDKTYYVEPKTHDRFERANSDFLRKAMAVMVVDKNGNFIKNALTDQLLADHFNNN